MAGIKITDLPAAASALLTDVYPVDQLPGPVTYKESNSQLLSLFKANGEALTAVNDTNVTMVLGGTPTTALLNASSMTLGWTGQLSVARGGTGNTTFTAYSVICAGTTATGAFQNVVGLGNAGEQLTSNGAGLLPTWQPSGAITPAALTKVDDTNVTLTLGGTPATALLQATSVTAGWTGQLSPARGGTGVNNGSNTLTLAGNLATAGVFATTFTMTGATNVTFPTSGTLSTTTGTVTSVSGTSNRITSSGGNTPVIDIAATYVGQTSVTTLGTIATGVWQGTVIGSTYGGTGVNNGASTLTLGGNLITSGAFASTFTMTGITGVTFPTSGTLATTAQIPTGAALTKTDDTNVTLTLGGSPTTALVNAASITAGWTGQLGLTRGGTAASLTASNGGIVYSGATALAILAGTATARQMLQSGASTTPAWSTTTWPATTTVNRILYSSSTSVIGEITTANSSVLVTDGSGVPSLSTTLPAFTTSSITFNPTTGGLVGTTTNDNVAAGKVGEFVSSIIAFASATSLTTNTAKDITSISLTAGDWDVWGNVGFNGNSATTFSTGEGWISSTSATVPDPSLFATRPYAAGTTIFTVDNVNFTVPERRFSLSGTTTVYLSAFAVFALNTCTAYGGIYARRVR